MNSPLPEMYGTDITVLERQQSRLKWQIQPQQTYFNDTHFSLLGLQPNSEQLLNEMMVEMKADPGMANGWPDLGKFPVPRPGFAGLGSNLGDMVDSSLSRTASCPSAAAGSKGGEPMVGVVGKESSKKRKADKTQNPKDVGTEEAREKRSKVESDEESKVTEQTNKNHNRSNSNSTITNHHNNKENSADSSKENSKASGAPKSDYIHVRARRGQATDSHSLAERVRREKISERMKYLQDLVPGCNKITGKAGMLDEIINYVQSLQRQVEFLSMKLATVNPRLDFNVENIFPKEIYPACTGSFPPIGISSEMANFSPYLPFNPVQQQLVSCSGMDMVISQPEMALRRTISAPVTGPDPTLLETSCFNQAQPSTTCWENDLQSLYNVEFNQGRPTLFAPQSFTETLEANHLKMEM